MMLEWIIFITGLTVVLACGGVILWQRKQMLALGDRLEISRKLLSGFQPSLGKEKNLDRYLEIVGNVLEAPSYAFYLFNPNNSRFVLAAVRVQVETTGRVGPSYSGLVPYIKEVYHPPISLPHEAYSSTKAQRIIEGEVPLVSVPIRGGRGMIRMGPVGNVSEKDLRRLEYIALTIENSIDILGELEKSYLQLETLQVTVNAVRTISKWCTDSLHMVFTISKMMVRSFGISGSFGIVTNGNQYEIPFMHTLNESKPGKISQIEAEAFYQSLGSSEGPRLIRKGDLHYDRLPSFLKHRGVEACYVHRLTGQNLKGILLFWFDQAKTIEKGRMIQLATVNETIDQLLKHQAHPYPVPALYPETFKLLARMLDNLNPFTVGYSEMMSRFSVQIGREMKLSSAELEALGLAAYLSNIGILGLNEQLLTKEGRYSDLEYEQMKQHAEVGAAIIESTLANDLVASFIRYHHERIDGNGYPSGLSGEEIPLGARIIAVVQTFLAKVNGRSYRDPLPFEQALLLLQSTAGTQLDSGVVNVFVQWFRNKQSNMLSADRPLGPCWSIGCVPSTICSVCPAYKSTIKNCWEYEFTLCQLHGKKCETCMIYTETLSRRNQEKVKLPG